MAKNNNLTDFLTGVAQAIRTKKGTTNLINPQDFESEIASIPIRKTEQEKSVTVTTNGTTEVTPDSGKALSKVMVTTNVQPTLQEKTVVPTTTQQIVTADSGKDGLSRVTVGAVTAEIDSNIVSENIKKDITILGVTGTLESGGSGGSGVDLNIAYGLTPPSDTTKLYVESETIPTKVNCISNIDSIKNGATVNSLTSAALTDSNAIVYDGYIYTASVVPGRTHNAVKCDINLEKKSVETGEIIFSKRLSPTEGGYFNKSYSTNIRGIICENGKIAILRYYSGSNSTGGGSHTAGELVVYDIDNDYVTVLIDESTEMTSFVPYNLLCLSPNGFPVFSTKLRSGASYIMYDYIIGYSTYRYIQISTGVEYGFMYDNYLCYYTTGWQKYDILTKTTTSFSCALNTSYKFRIEDYYYYYASNTIYRYNVKTGITQTVTALPSTNTSAKMIGLYNVNKQQLYAGNSVVAYRVDNVYQVLANELSLIITSNNFKLASSDNFDLYCAPNIALLGDVNNAGQEVNSYLYNSTTSKWVNCNTGENWVRTYQITTTLSNVTATGGNPTKIEEGGTATLTFVADNGWALPESITVTGANYVYDKTAGTVILSNATGNVTISITAVEGQTLYGTVTFSGSYYDVYGGNSADATDNNVGSSYSGSVEIMYEYIRITPTGARYRWTTSGIPTATGALELISGSGQYDDFVFKVNGNGTITAEGDD